MPILKIPTPLRSYTNGQGKLALDGSTVQETLTNLVLEYPQIKKHIYDDKNHLRPYVNIFLGDENIQELDGSETRLKPNDTLLIIPSIAGGNSDLQLSKTDHWFSS